SLDRPEPFPLGLVAGGVFLWGPIPPATSEEPPVSLPMQHAWDAAVPAWGDFLPDLGNGGPRPSGGDPASGVASELARAEWTRGGMVVDVRNGDRYEVRDGKRTVRWSDIVVWEAVQAQKLGTIDWDAEWKEDVARREKAQLPNKRGYLRELERRIQERYGV